jgi:hypothetical protein
MEKKTLEVNEENTKRLVRFFDLFGFETYAKELLHAWDEYESKLNAFLYLKHENPNTIDGYHDLIVGGLAEYECAFANIKKVFGYYASKIAIMIDDAKWRRVSI